MTPVVLEESLLFYQEKDADTFIKFLGEENQRTAGIRLVECY
jgi:hypothetical protein